MRTSHWGSVRDRKKLERDASKCDGYPFLCGWRHLANMIKYAFTAVDCCCVLHTYFVTSVLHSPRAYVKCSMTLTVSTRQDETVIFVSLKKWEGSLKMKPVS